MRKAYIVAAMRSPIGRKINLSPQELCRQVLHELFIQNSLDPELVDVFVVGSAISLKSPAQAMHKEIAMLAEMDSASSESVDKACSSGSVAVYRAAQSIWHGGADIAVGGGVEIMSKDAEATRKSLTDPSTQKLMYQLSDEFAAENRISKEEHDRYSAESYRRSRENLFNTGNYATAIIYPGNSDQFLLTHDELVTAHESFIDFERVSRKNPIKGCNVISYASSSKPGDGAAFVVLASPRAVRKLKLKPLAKFSAFTMASGSVPRNFVAKPAEAIIKLFAKTKLSLDEIDYFLVNEAFATSPLWVMRKLCVPRDKINPRGGAIACGHPLGMSGARLVIEAVHILNQERKRRIVFSVCNATDEATAGLVETI